MGWCADTSNYDGNLEGGCNKMCSRTKGRTEACDGAAAGSRAAEDSSTEPAVPETTPRGRGCRHQTHHTHTPKLSASCTPYRVSGTRRLAPAWRGGVGSGLAGLLNLVCSCVQGTGVSVSCCCCCCSSPAHPCSSTPARKPRLARCTRRTTWGQTWGGGEGRCFFVQELQQQQHHHHQQQQQAADWAQTRQKWEKRRQNSALAAWAVPLSTSKAPGSTEAVPATPSPLKALESRVHAAHAPALLSASSLTASLAGSSAASSASCTCRQWRLVQTFTQRSNCACPFAQARPHWQTNPCYALLRTALSPVLPSSIPAGVSESQFKMQFKRS